MSIVTAWSAECRLMDHTTYSDARVLSLIDESFIPVRVDGDRRPDLNDRYNLGGWPTTAFLTSSGDILSGGTYLTIDEMVSALQQVSEAYRMRAADLVNATKPEPIPRISSGGAVLATMLVGAVGLFGMEKIDNAIGTQVEVGSLLKQHMAADLSRAKLVNQVERAIRIGRMNRNEGPAVIEGVKVDVAALLGNLTGVAHDVALGDVVVATRINAFHSGREGIGGFLPRLKGWLLAHGLEQLAQARADPCAQRRPVGIERLGAQLLGLVGSMRPEAVVPERNAAALEVERKALALEELGPIAKEPRARERLEVEWHRPFDQLVAEVDRERAGAVTYRRTGADVPSWRAEANQRGDNVWLACRNHS